MTTYTKYSAALAAACMLASGSAAFAGDDGKFSFEAELEVSIDSVVSSDTAANEMTDTTATLNIGWGFDITDNISLFSAVTLESLTDPSSTRALEDMGLYVGELGLAFSLGGADLSVGKISPAFGIAWDATPGFYGTALAEDYELAEMIGATVETGLGGGTLSFGLFYADNTIFSGSMGAHRARNTTAAGGAGNTGKLNNVALQWSKEFGSTTLTLGARHLSAGVGDAKDETGFSIGAVHALNENVEIMGEIAVFEGFGGSADDATYATIGASFGSGSFTYSGAVSYRDAASAGETSMVSVGVDYELDNGMTIGGGLALIDDAGIASQQLGMNLVIPIGG